MATKQQHKIFLKKKEQNKKKICEKLISVKEIKKKTKNEKSKKPTNHKSNDTKKELKVAKC